MANEISNTPNPRSITPQGVDSVPEDTQEDSNRIGKSAVQHDPTQHAVGNTANLEGRNLLTVLTAQLTAEGASKGVKGAAKPFSTPEIDAPTVDMSTFGNDPTAVMLLLQKVITNITAQEGKANWQALKDNQDSLQKETDEALKKIADAQEAAKKALEAPHHKGGLPSWFSTVLCAVGAAVCFATGNAAAGALLVAASVLSGTEEVLQATSPEWLSSTVGGKFFDSVLQVASQVAVAMSLAILTGGNPLIAGAVVGSLSAGQQGLEKTGVLHGEAAIIGTTIAFAFVGVAASNPEGVAAILSRAGSALSNLVSSGAQVAEEAGAAAVSEGIEMTTMSGRAAAEAGAQVAEEAAEVVPNAVQEAADEAQQVAARVARREVAQVQQALEQAEEAVVDFDPAAELAGEESASVGSRFRGAFQRAFDQYKSFVQPLADRVSPEQINKAFIAMQAAQVITQSTIQAYNAGIDIHNAQLTATQINTQADLKFELVKRQFIIGMTDQLVDQATSFASEMANLNTELAAAMGTYFQGMHAVTQNIGSGAA